MQQVQHLQPLASPQHQFETHLIQWQQRLKSQEPLFFVGDVDRWYRYRQDLVVRCNEWNSIRDKPGVSQLPDIVRPLFPPPGFSPQLFASSKWTAAPCSRGPTDIPRFIVVTMGGIYGGDDGPSGLFDYAVAVLSQDKRANAAFLQLDGGHSALGAQTVLTQGLRWLCHWLGASGLRKRIILLGFSMASQPIAEVLREFEDFVVGIGLVAGQTAGTERLAQSTKRRALLIHGAEDAIIPSRCAFDLRDLFGQSGSEAELHIVSQDPIPPMLCKEEFERERFLRHHLWRERWDVQDILLSWLRSF